jgi:membrane-bound metal-dependent hydrolase YbcI (DUF457 family)
MPYPYTPYHIGPSFLLGFLLRRWVDIPVFVLANFAIDLIVLIVGLWHPRSFVPEHAHTLLIGTGIGMLWGIAAYFFRRLFIWIMLKIRLPYKTNIRKMIFSGIFGTWVHIFIDSLYQSDIKLFWPSKLIHPSFRFNRREIDFLLILCFIAAFVVYMCILKRQKNLGNEKNVKRKHSSTA